MHKDAVDAVLGCQPVSSRLISIRLRAAPFNITIIQVYAPTSGHDDSEVATPGIHRPNTKEGHSGCTRGLKC